MYPAPDCSFSFWHGAPHAHVCIQWFISLLLLCVF